MDFRGDQAASVRWGWAVWWPAGPPAPVPESHSGVQMTPKSTLEYVAQRRRCTKTTYDLPRFVKF